MGQSALAFFRIQIIHIYDRFLYVYNMTNEYYQYEYNHHRTLSVSPFDEHQHVDVRRFLSRHVGVQLREDFEAALLVSSRSFPWIETICVGST